MDLAIATLYTLNSLNSEPSLIATDWSVGTSEAKIASQANAGTMIDKASKPSDSVASPDYIAPSYSSATEQSTVEPAVIPLVGDKADKPNATNLSNSSEVRDMPKQVLITQVPSEPPFVRPAPPRTQLQAFDLVTMAYQGYFQTQSIPRYSRFMTAVKSRRVRAEDLVQAAIASGRLSSTAIADDDYLQAVNILLRGLMYGDNYRGRR